MNSFRLFVFILFNLISQSAFSGEWEKMGEAEGVVNLFQKSWPLYTILGLRKQLKKSDITENQTVLNLLKAGNG